MSNSEALDRMCFARQCKASANWEARIYAKDFDGDVPFPHDSWRPYCPEHAKKLRGSEFTLREVGDNEVLSS